MRNSLMFGAVLGLSAAVPIFFQPVIDAVSNPPPAKVAARVGPASSVNSVGLSTGNRKARVKIDAHGHYSADLMLNGRRVDGMIDTGATVMAMNVSTARRIGISIASLDFRHTVTTANGPAKAAVATIASLEIGRIRLNDVETVVLEDRALGRTLVGMNALNRLSGFRVENNVLLLEQ